jgi:hypothetical protein
VRVRDFDLGGAFAFLVALTVSVMTAEIVFIEGLYYWHWILALVVGTILAWAAFWAWRRERWLIAGGLFFLSLGWPGGFFVVLTVPFSFALFVVSLVRAWSERRARRKLARPAALAR